LILDIIAPDNSGLALKERSIEARTLERYSDILRLHIAPAIGQRPLQKITATDIDQLYGDLEKKLAPRTMGLVHVIVKSCFQTAVKKKLLAANPVEDAEKPNSDDEEAGTILDEEELGRLVQAFKGLSVYSIVAVAAFTGTRRNEILALRWIDVDLDAKTIAITRSVEETKAHGRRVKGPKTKRGRRTIQIDDGLVALLRTERERHLRLVAGILPAAPRSIWALSAFPMKPWSSLVAV
jgi:integrase